MLKEVILGLFRREFLFKVSHLDLFINYQEFDTGNFGKIFHKLNGYRLTLYDQVCATGNNASRRIITNP